MIGIKKREKGFTLVELLVTTFIIALLASLVMVNQREGEKSFSLTRSAHQLAQDLRNTGAKALAGKELYDNFPDGGYGLYFENNSNSYIVFADCNDNAQYDGLASVCPDCTSGSCIDNVHSEMVEEIYMESPVKILNISPSSPLSITFIPPDPIININPPPVFPDTAAVVALSINGKTKTIKMNSVGLIDVD